MAQCLPVGFTQVPWCILKEQEVERMYYLSSKAEAHDVSFISLRVQALCSPSDPRGVKLCPTGCVVVWGWGVSRGPGCIEMLMRVEGAD